MFFAGGPGKAIPLSEYVHESIGGIDNPQSVRAGFAYATLDGISELCKKDGSDWRDKVSSKWLIGLDQGLTQPAALENLREYPNSETKIIYPGDELSKNALFRRPRFHAKLLFIESTAAEGQEHLITTSANMTGSALGRMPTNYEVGLMKSRNSGLSDSEVDDFENWWNLAWSEGDELSDKLLETYSEIRSDYRSENPDVSEYESSETITHASDADCLWIETREMTGGSRNQVEFNEELTSFFSHSGSIPGEVIIAFRGTEENRPLNTRTTDPPFGVSICLIYLPTGYDYQYQVIHFEKLRPDSTGTPRFELRVAEPGDEVVDMWKRRSREHAIMDETVGGREYGYY